ncbi:MAG: hypothetical protein AB2605_02575 [Candidatus Thiodiazotropha sp.]
MIRNRVIRLLQLREEGLPTDRVAFEAGLEATPEVNAAIDAMLLLSPECLRVGKKWVLRGSTRSSKILAEIRKYSDASGKRIFRLSAALAKLSPSEHPTAEELESLLGVAGGEFELLPNAMIKRVSS